jgi:hypothetical protein
MCLEYPELELSNLAENSMRPVALGRKNWIHVGSSQVGPKIAAILSIVESCRRLKFPVSDSLAAVLPGLASAQFDDFLNSLPQPWQLRGGERKRLLSTGIGSSLRVLVLFRLLRVFPRLGLFLGNPK